MHEDEQDTKTGTTTGDATTATDGVGYAGTAETAPDRRDADDPTADFPRSEATTAEMQRSATEDSPAVDSDTDLDAVQALPGEGGPDDGGDIEVDPHDLNLSGDSIPGHPKPGEPDPADAPTGGGAAPSHPKPGPPRPRD
ncbi:hypothetical protein [Frigoribacterium sp. Leaf44]|jgi:hypothetical protein|uniref:hypothetical protein n=1 Tax=Frigoribacterium sp. Leaf44 TaxID=1736220 RepID=UPI00070038A6|nr:hypothetical protein [Frigoribacterium sp. Leaf44]KQN42429.1 hypothetical protein ASE87_07960 [Frigoribacterium sp. Leaf44]